MILHLSNSLELLSLRLKENIESPEDALVVISDMQSKTALLVELESFGLKIQENVEDAKELHFFGIPKMAFESDAKVFVYVLSPCMHFWSDICSDKEAKKLTKHLDEKHKDALQEYLYDRSKLLANNSSMLRESISYLIEHASDIREEYVVKDWMMDSPYVRQDVVHKVVKSSPTLFEAIQGDLLLLGKEKVPALSDDSVQIHDCCTLKREIEELYQYIQKASFDRVIVYAPDIEPYRPYIQSLFTHSTEIVGSYQYEILPTFIDILRGNTRGLFKNKSFQKKWGIEAEDLALTAYLKKDILSSWISEDVISVQDAEVLAKFLSALNGLAIEVEPRPCSMWQRRFMTVLDSYFAEDLDEFYLIKRAIMKAYHNDANMTLDEAIDYFKGQIEPLQKQAIAPLIFTNLGLCRTVSRDIVCFLGMNEGACPRSLGSLIIEAIVAAKKALYISYQGFSFKERALEAPHAVIRDILDTLNLGDDFIKRHALASQSDRPYLPEPAVLEIGVEPSSKNVDAVSISELSQLAKYPLKAYYQHGFGLHLFDKKTEDTLEIKNQRLIRQKLFENKNIAEELSLLPKAIREAACMLFEEENDYFQEQAKVLGISQYSPLQVEFTPAVKTIEREGASLKLPALELNLGEKTVVIRGTTTGIYNQGIVLFENKSKAAVLKVWPELLLVNLFQKELGVAPRLLFLKDGKSEEVQIENPQEKLKEYVRYALEARERASLLYPALFTALSKHEGAKDMDSVRDPYLELHLSRTGPDALQKDWSWARNKSELLFGEVYEF